MVVTTEFSRVRVHPIYGWGWYDSRASSPTIEAPSDFEALVRESGTRELRGSVVSEGHQYLGADVRLTQRHVEWDGTVNVDVSGVADEQFTVSGFAEIPLESLQNG